MGPLGTALSAYVFNLLLQLSKMMLRRPLLPPSPVPPLTNDICLLLSRKLLVYNVAQHVIPFTFQDLIF